MLSRVAGRLLTGPAAFFLAGLIDAALLTVTFLRWALAQRIGSLRRRFNERESEP